METRVACATMKGRPVTVIRPTQGVAQAINVVAAGADAVVAPVGGREVHLVVGGDFGG